MSPQAKNILTALVAYPLIFMIFWNGNVPTLAGEGDGIVRAVVAEGSTRPALHTITPAATATPIPTATPHPRQEIIDYIAYTFENEATTAMKLLECENRSLNPSAVHVNDDGSKDIGVFQISEKWQQVQAKFLKNWKVNIEIAHQLFRENGNFKLWTCGKRLGI